MQQETAPATKKPAPVSKIVSQVVRAIFGILMFGLILIGILIIIAKGFSFPTILIQIGSFKLIGLPFSYLIFGALGLCLDRVYKGKAIFMLAFAYSSWELTDQIAQGIMSPNTGGANVPELLIWSVVIGLALYIVRPKLDFNHWIAIVLFAYYANLPFLENYMGPSSTTFIIELIEEIIWSAFILLAFHRESDPRGKTVREFLLGAKPILQSTKRQEIEVNEKSALACEPS